MLFEQRQRVEVGPELPLAGLPVEDALVVKLYVGAVTLAPATELADLVAERGGPAQAGLDAEPPAERAVNSHDEEKKPPLAPLPPAPQTAASSNTTLSSGSRSVSS